MELFCSFIFFIIIWMRTTTVFICFIRASIEGSAAGLAEISRLVLKSNLLFWGSYTVYTNFLIFFFCRAFLKKKFIASFIFKSAIVFLNAGQNCIMLLFLRSMTFIWITLSQIFSGRPVRKSQIYKYLSICLLCCKVYKITDTYQQ